jgi:hypothetical protein
MNDKIVILSTLRKDLLTFIDELIEFLPEEQELVLMKSFAKIVIISDVADYILQNLAPLEDKVINREEAYFINNAMMFEKLQNKASQVNHFKKLWETTEDQENKEVVWQWLHHFIRLARHYGQLL